MLVSMLLVFGALTPVAASDHRGTDHCPDHDSEEKVERDGQTTSKPVDIDGTTVHVNIDGKTVTFTDADGNPLEVEFCVKAATGTSDVRTGSSFTTEGAIENPGGQAPAISYVVVYAVTEPLPDEPIDLTFALTKSWDGDIGDIDTDTLTVTFEIDATVAEVAWTLGSAPLQVDEGQSITILAERVEGLPDDCTSTATLPGPYIVDASDADADGLITLEVTNAIDCDDVVEPELALLFTKDWTGDTDGVDLTEVAVTFTFDLDGEARTYNLGAQPLAVTAGAELTDLDELVGGLPDDCTYTTDLPDAYTVDPTDAVAGVITIEVTNDLDCEDVIVEPTALFSFAKDWDGDAIDTDDVTVSFTIGEGDDAIVWELGDDPVEVTAGDTLAPITETVTGLPDECTYTSDLEGSYTVPNDIVDGQTLVLTVTNTVDCDDVEVAPTALFSFAKAWAGDAIDTDEVTVSFTIGEGDDAIVWELGDDPVEVTAGTTLAPITETVTGLPDECDYVSNLDGSFTIPTDIADGQPVTLVVTNTVDCADVLGVVIVDRPPVVVERPGVGEVITRAPIPTEVLGVAFERAAQLPRTGASLAGLLALSLAGLTLGGTLLRRRTD
jgi:hypothetical protein